MTSTNGSGDPAAEGQRLRRHATVRRGPVRNPVVRRPTAMFRDLVDGSVGVARDTTQASSATVQGAVEGTVAAAYALSDQLMSRGYSAARQNSRPFGGPTMSDSRFSGPDNGWPSPYPPSSTGRPGGQGGPWGAPGLTNPWIEPWMQMMRMWTDSLFMLASPANPTGPWASVMGLGGNPGVSLEVQSSRPARVTLDLAPGSDFEQLSVDPLRLTTNPSAERLEGVTISARPGQYLVRLEVPDTLDPGLYMGTVGSTRRRTLGELRVEITGDAKSAPAKRASAKKKAKRKKGAKKSGS